MNFILNILNWNHIFTFTESCNTDYVDKFRYELTKRTKCITEKEIEDDDDGSIGELLKDIEEKRELCIKNGSGYANHKQNFGFCSHCFKSKLIKLFISLLLLCLCK